MVSHTNEWDRTEKKWEIRTCWTWTSRISSTLCEELHRFWCSQIHIPISFAKLQCFDKKFRIFFFTILSMEIHSHREKAFLTRIIQCRILVGIPVRDCSMLELHSLLNPNYWMKKMTPPNFHISEFNMLWSI